MTSLFSYADFQISDGKGGTAEQEANAVFVDPFKGVDLATVSSTDLDNVQTMREAAEAAETDDFNPQIDAATGAAADALNVGKIKNKVLKLTVSDCVPGPCMTFLNTAAGRGASVKYSVGSREGRGR
jgi:hypothetical protein